VDVDVVKAAVAALIRARQTLEEALEPGCTLIAIDLLLAAGKAAAFDRRARPCPGPTVKDLFSQLTHSNRGVRIHFNRLVEEGFLVVEPGREDRRTRIVRLTPRGEQVLRRTAAALVQSIDRPGAANGGEPRSATAGRSRRKRADGSGHSLRS
jgi:hypothetical protein